METVGSFFRNAFVRFHKVSKHVCLGRRDDARINVGPRTEIVENTSGDGEVDEIKGFLPLFTGSVEIMDAERTDRPSCLVSIGLQKLPLLQDFRNPWSRKAAYR